jgi:hypothetical protein
MTDQHRATPEDWGLAKSEAEDGSHADSCILELRSRVEALEAAQRYQFRSATEKAPTTRLYSYSVGPAKPLDELGQGHTLVSPDPASAEARPAGLRVAVETTYGSEAAADAVQLLRFPMVVQGTFEHGGETYRFKAKPERESAMPELRAASAEAQPAGGLVEMLGDVWSKGQPLHPCARVAAIRTVATWLDRFALHGSGEYAQAAKVLRQEVGQ